MTHDTATGLSATLQHMRSAWQANKPGYAQRRAVVHAEPREAQYHGSLKDSQPSRRRRYCHAETGHGEYRKHLGKRQ